MKANENKRSTIFKIDGKIIIVKNVFVQSPYITSEEKIKINTETREVLSRA